MADNVAATRPALAVFASDKGPGDAERAPIMAQAGTLLARHGAKLICLADETLDVIPLITSARAAGGEVLIVADAEFVAPPALNDVAGERIDDPEARLLTRSIEGSNVTATSALVEMIEASRSWDTQLKMIGDVRDMDSATANLMQLPR